MDSELPAEQHSIVLSIYGKENKLLLQQTDYTPIEDGSYIYTFGFTVEKGKAEFDVDSLIKTEA